MNSNDAVALHSRRDGFPRSAAASGTRPSEPAHHPFIWLVYASTRGSCAEPESWWRGIYSRGIGFDGHAMSRAGLAAQFTLNLHQSLGP